MNDSAAARVAVVTGAAGAAGRAIAARLTGAGWRVAGLDERPCECSLPLMVDLGDRQRVREAAQHVLERLGPISLLVTTCPVHDAAAFGQMPRSRWERLLRAHLASAANACAAVLPLMIDEGRGTVVTTASSASLHGAAGEVYHSAASGTILAFTKSLAVEVAPRGVRMNCVAVSDVGGGPPEPTTLDALTDTVIFLADEGCFYVGQVFEPCGEARV